VAAEVPVPEEPSLSPIERVARFDAFDRSLHGVLMASFLGLAFTGIPLLMAKHGARAFFWFGDFRVAAVLHRIFAVLMICCFALHLGRLARRLFLEKDYGILWGPGSMVPQPRDLRDLAGHVRWFLGRGERPSFDRFTYWEKFDYWAVFWGMGIIGGSGLLLWFPRLFAHLVPGWAFNIAMLIHGEEALLAVGFIFTVHFFNGHLRPEKFPMDTVIFTGSLPLEELREERPDEYARLVEEGRLEALRAGRPSRRLERIGRAGGTVAVVLGLLLVGITIYAFL
jgi:cytochrome b subunit of formate dehydrogenase